MKTKETMTKHCHSIPTFLRLTKSQANATQEVTLGHRPCHQTQESSPTDNVGFDDVQQQQGRLEANYLQVNWEFPIQTTFLILKPLLWNIFMHV